MGDRARALLHEEALAEHLDSDNLLRLDVPCHHHPAKLAFAEDAAELKVLDAEPAMRRRQAQRARTLHCRTVP